MKDKKIKIPSLEERQKDHERKLRELELKNRLEGSPEIFLNNKESDEYLDVLGVIVKLNGGRELTYEEYISEFLVEYRSHFSDEFFCLIAKLYGLNPIVMKNYIKPRIVPFFIIKFIYARFPARVVNTLMRKAPWTDIPGIREVKLFQNLSPVATVQLDLYIEQCIVMMRECDNLKEFKTKYLGAYTFYFQRDLFEDNETTSS